VEVFRLCTVDYVALDGEGARLFGGRWNTPRKAVIYTSEHLSLAILEFLVHVQPDNLPDRLVSLQIHIPDNVTSQIYHENTAPAEADASEIGDAWIRHNQALLLTVPSALVPERNVLINPRHKEIKRVKVAETKPFEFDPRLFNQ
jgi:RES domain-containing protein